MCLILLMHSATMKFIPPIIHITHYSTHRSKSRCILKFPVSLKLSLLIDSRYFHASSATLPLHCADIHICHFNSYFVASVLFLSVKFHRVRLPIENSSKLLCITESKGKIEFSSELPVGELSHSSTTKQDKRLKSN